jgi:hypothetical protein
MTGPISLQEWRLEHAQKAVASRAATPCYALSCICTVKLNSPVTVENQVGATQRQLDLVFPRVSQNQRLRVLHRYSLA